MFEKSISILEKGLVGFLMLFCAFSVFLGNKVTAAESSSFLLNSQVGSAESSLSSNFSLCSRFSSVGVQGDSTSFQLQPSLNCTQQVVPDTGGGGRRGICGNGIIEHFEQCDDGNVISGDACSSTCFIEDSGTGTTGTGTTGTGTTGTGTTGTGTTGTGTTGAGTVGTGTTGTGTTGTETTGTGTTGTGTTGTGTTGTETTGTGTTGTGTTGTGTTTGTTGTGTAGTGTTGTTVGGPELPDVSEPEGGDGEVPQPEPGAIETFVPGTIVQVPIFRGAAPVCGNALVEQPEQCDDGNLMSGDGCSVICRFESFSGVQDISSGMPGFVYVTNDLSTLFFEQFPNGSGNYSITLRSSEKNYALKVLHTSDGYFSFQVQEEIPDGVYQILVQDEEQDSLSRMMYLQIKQNETIALPYEMTFAGQNLIDEVPQGFPVYEEQPILRGMTTLAATIAIYSRNLDKTFIVFTDNQDEFEFQYPEKLVRGVSESLLIVVHYENGHVSREQEITFQLEDGKGVAFVSELYSSQLFLGFIFFFVAFVAALISSAWSFFMDDRRKKKETTSGWKKVFLPIVKIVFISGIVSLVLFSFLLKTMALTTTPNILPYEGVLKTAGGTAITTSHDFRFSVWLDADFTAGVDRDGAGAIPLAAPGYSTYTEVRSITPDSSGFFQVNIGELNPIPDFNTNTHLYLQVEIKTTGSPDTSYETLDIDGVDNATDRQPFGTIPYARNSDFIDNAELGTSDGNIVQLGAGDVFPVSVIPGGTNAGTFEIDSDNTGGVTQLSFGDVLNNQILSFDPDGVALADGWFNFSDDVNINGDLTITGTINGVTLGPVNRSIQYQPEYPNVIYDSIGPGDHKGKMEILYIDTDGAAAPDNFNSYKWSTNQATLQDKDLVVRFQIPDNFVSWQATPITLRYRTEDGILANNKIDVSIEDTTGTLIGTLTGNSDLVSTNFTTTNITFGGGGTFAVGSEITLFIKMSALNIGAAYVSDVNFHYVGN